MYADIIGLEQAMKRVDVCAGMLGTSWNIFSGQTWSPWLPPWVVVKRHF
jgi:hypothetical protein